jgi:hypothetical protein
MDRRIKLLSTTQALRNQASRVCEVDPKARKLSCLKSAKELIEDMGGEVKVSGPKQRPHVAASLKVPTLDNEGDTRMVQALLGITGETIQVVYRDKPSPTYELKLDPDYPDNYHWAPEQRLENLVKSALALSILSPVLKLLKSVRDEAKKELKQPEPPKLRIVRNNNLIESNPLAKTNSKLNCFGRKRRPTTEEMLGVA